MKTAFLPQAKSELDDAFAWYENQVVGLGYEFLDEVDASIRMISSFPEMFMEIRSGFRRGLLNRFPYGLIYGLDNDRIIIIALAHSRKNPEYWVDRI